MRNKVVQLLKRLDAVAVENPAYPGTPDVNYIGGWIELKYMRVWTHGAGVVKIHHFTPQQRAWLHRRWRKGGAVWLLLKVGTQWLLFDGATAATKVGKTTRLELERLAKHTKFGQPTSEELEQWLLRN